jgi:hypothetical protein
MERSAPDPDVVSYLSKMRLATTLDSYVAVAFFRAQGSMRGELLFEPELVERVERVVSDWNDEPRDLDRPPESSDEQAPVVA